MSTEAPERRSSWITRGLGVSVLVGFALSAVWIFPVKQLLLDLMEWSKTAGPFGWLGFAVIYVLVTITLLPTSPLTMGGGFLFGPIKGFLVVWVSENVAALACFLIGRYMARPAVENMVKRSPLLAALDGAMQDRGFSLLVLIRHSPLAPFGILNYSMSLTGIGPLAYIGATVLGTAIPAFAYTYIGSTFAELSDVLQGKPKDGVGSYVYWGGLAATVVATLAVSWFTRRALNERLEKHGIRR
ncbi:MAG: TVP38/TMEM64 family protein [Myxococcales bacterium]|nr:TVP38/TMEM64 family protein [Myxococcales bacterium]